ncbi:bcl-2-binding component 3, isoforms 3/4-like [Ursus maritimus]|uniref:Bcl-2-binding component 3, isoforms 3/4-like n=1 Tax=Ursus maritimus TaxID=29073 RepID=A0A8M1H0U5_URSMA|nr:bcl-2-binding component 3, isoforms 3/4-like [Ursus maritimus]
MGEKIEVLRVQFQRAALGLPYGQPGGWPPSRGSRRQGHGIKQSKGNPARSSRGGSPHPHAIIPALLLPPPRTQPGVARDPWRCRREGGVCAPRALARPRGDRKPGHRGLSLEAAALPEPGRKFCRALSAGASLAVLLNRKPGCAGAGRWRRERRTPKPRAPAGTSGSEASERTPRAPAPRGLPGLALGSPAQGDGGSLTYIHPLAPPVQSMGSPRPALPT